MIEDGSDQRHLPNLQTHLGLTLRLDTQSFRCSARRLGGDLELLQDLPDGGRLWRHAAINERTVLVVHLVGMTNLHPQDGGAQ